MSTGFAPDEVENRAVYRTLTTVVVPRPIDWISTVDESDNDKLVSYSLFNVACVDPPVVAFSHNRRDDGGTKYTERNVTETGEFVHNLVDIAVARQMHLTGDDLGPEKSEFDAFGVERTPTARVSPPRMAEAPVAFECTLRRSMELGSHALISATLSASAWLTM